MIKNKLSTLVLILALIFSFNTSVFANEVEATESATVEQTIKLPADTVLPILDDPIIVYSHFPYEH